MYRLRKWETFDNVLCNGRDKTFNCFLVYHDSIVKKADEILNSSVFSTSAHQLLSSLLLVRVFAYGIFHSYIL